MAVASLSAIRNLPSLVHDPVEDFDNEPPSAAGLVALLRSPDEDVRNDALADLAELVDGAYGEDGAYLGKEVRAGGGIALLAWMLSDPSPEVQQTALMILGNLCSDSVDPNSRTTKAVLLQSARAVLACVHTEEPAILVFACGALQNLCYEREWSERAVELDVHRRLEQLVFHEDAMIVRYASGALQNMTRALQLNDLSELAMEAIKERTLEHKREGAMQQRALGVIARAATRIPAQQRQRRHDRGTRRRRLADNSDADSTCTSSSTWSFDKWPGWSQPGSRPSSRASSRSDNESHSSYVSARSEGYLSRPEP